jgi:hypothetical protein
MKTGHTKMEIRKPNPRIPKPARSWKSKTSFPPFWKNEGEIPLQTGDSLSGFRLLLEFGFYILRLGLKIFRVFHVFRGLTDWRVIPKSPIRNSK